MEFRPIGFVKSGFKKPAELIFACEKGLLAETRSSVVIDEEFSGGLRGLKKFSHAFIIYNLHKARGVEMITHPGPPSISLPKVGVFASRSQKRPNKIALRLVEITGVKGNVLDVRGLDAINGSPVLDIKPYVPGFDRPGKFKNAPWYNWLDR
jgi:tRNA-Thr(GGU) m(6)t(6)A37 methyltransferase TsaA